MPHVRDIAIKMPYWILHQCPNDLDDDTQSNQHTEDLNNDEDEEVE